MNEIFAGERGQKIGKALLAAVVVLGLFLAVQTLIGLKKFSYIGKEIYPQRTIMASGTGEAYAIPDIASLSFGATETGDTVQAAQEKVEAKINKALAIVKDAGVEDKDIKTTGYNVYPKYEWQQIYCITTPCPQGKNVLKGYEVSQNITVKIRETEKAGDIVTKVGATGVNNISGLEFTVDDRDQYVAEARSEAIKKAEANAKRMADELGVKLGKMLYFNENAGGYPYYAEGMGGGAMDMKVSAVAPQAATLPQGETKITSQVSITYELR